MNRGRRSENIYFEDNDYLSFIELLIESSELWGVNIYAFSLMPNHYHLLINTPLGNLSRFMRHVDGVYTQRFNKSHELEGSLFKGRYKSILIEFDSYFLHLVRYIHRNPLRANLVNSIDDFRWSSHHAYVKNTSELEWIKSELLLSMLSEKKSNQVIEYKKLMGIEDNEKLIKVFKSKKWPSFLGSDEFILSIKKKYFSEKKDIEIPDLRNLAPEVKLIKEVICEYFEIDADSLCIKKRQSNNEPRNLAIFLSRYLRNDSLNKICKDYFLGSHTSASRIVSSVKELIITDPEIENKVAELKRMIVKCQVKI